MDSTRQTALNFTEVFIRFKEGSTKVNRSYVSTLSTRLVMCMEFVLLTSVLWEPDQQVTTTRPVRTDYLSLSTDQNRNLLLLDPVRPDKTHTKFIVHEQLYSQSRSLFTIAIFRHPQILGAQQTTNKPHSIQRTL